MLRRPVDRSASVRRPSGRNLAVSAAAIGTLLLAAACEADPSSSSATGSGSAEPTTSTAAPAPGAERATTTEPAQGAEPTGSTTDDPGPDRTDVVTGGTAVSQPGSGATGAGGIRTVDFADLTYPTSVCSDVIDDPPRGGFQLTDGEAHAGEDEADGPYTVQLRQPRSFGDVNGDGHEDAALVLTCSRGGQPVPMGWIYTADDSGPRPLAGVELDPDSLPITGVLDTSLSSVRIAGATVVTDWDVYLDGDALCCPAKTAVVVWTWTDGHLTPGTPMLTRTTPDS